MKKQNKKIFAVAVVIFILLIIVILIPKKKTIYLNDYIITEYAGYNGYGKISKLELDEEKIKEDFDIRYSKKDMGYLDFVSPVATMTSLVNYEVDKAGGLSNGDEINVIISCLDSINNLFNVKVEYSDQKVVVSGLEDIVYYDPFENININFSGKIGFADYEIDASDTGIPTLEYWINPDDLNASNNGDTVKVTIKGSQDPTYFMNTYGKVPEYWEKDVVVEGLLVPVVDFSQLTDENFEYLQSATIEMINEKFSKDFTIRTMRFVNALDVYYYVFSDKLNNSIYVLYLLNVENKKDGQSGDVYFASVFENVYVKGNEIDLDILQSKYVGAHNVKIGNRSFPGYDSYESFIEKTTTTNIDNRELFVASYIDSNPADKSKSSLPTETVADEEDEELPDYCEPEYGEFRGAVCFSGYELLPEVFTNMENLPNQLKAFLDDQGYEKFFRDRYYMITIDNSSVKENEFSGWLEDTSIESHSIRVTVHYDIGVDDITFSIEN